MKFCTRCGTPAGAERFCTSCGAELEVAAPASAPPVIVAAGGVNPWLVVAAVVLLLGTIAVGGLLLLRRDDPARADTKPRTTPTATVPVNSVPSPTPTKTLTVTATPTPQAVPRYCWDGELAPDGGTCDHASEGAVRAAFNLEGRSCVYTDRGASHAGAVNLDCGNLHVAIYESSAAREQRLAQYGLGRGGCENYADEVVFCGPDKEGRYVRTYARSTGILLYVSSLDRGSVAGVDQMPADLPLHGQAGE